MENRIIKALKNYIEMRGYVENLGQQELLMFKDWINKQPISYAEKSRRIDALNNAIYNL